MSHLILATSSPMPCKGARGVQAQEVRCAKTCKPALHLPLGFLDGGCGRAGEAVSQIGLTSHMNLIYPFSFFAMSQVSTIIGPDPAKVGLHKYRVSIASSDYFMVDLWAKNRDDASERAICIDASYLTRCENLGEYEVVDVDLIEDDSFDPPDIPLARGIDP